MSHLDDGMLHTFLDGELDAAGEARLREHLATCADCRSRLDLARTTRTRAHEILRFADPLEIEQPDFATVLARRTPQAPGATPVRRGPSVRPLLLPWAASLVLAVGAGWFAQQLLTGGGTPGAGGAVERVATMQSEESALPPSPAPSPDAAEVPEAGGAARVFSGAESAAGAAPSARGEGAAPDAPLTAVTADADAPRAAAAGIAEPPPATNDVTVSASRRQVEAAEAREEQAGVDLARAPDTADQRQAPGRVTTTGAAPAREGRTRDAQAESAVRSRGAAMQAAAAPPPPPALPLAPTPAGWPSAWSTVEAAGAARALGEVPVVIADLEVESYQVSADGSGAVRVVQRLPGGEALELLQRRQQDDAIGVDGAPAARDAERAGDTVAAFAAPAQLGFARAGIEILIRAQVSPDSLQRLREAVR